MGLGILSAGLIFSRRRSHEYNYSILPRQYSGVTIGMSSMLRIVGSSIGPALAAMYMQTNQSQVINKGN